MEYIDLRHSFASIERPKILVFGDLMLDRYSWGNVERISPEAPIPVLSVQQENQRLGGAGNVVMNLNTLGAEVIVCGLIGEDEAGTAVYDLLQEQQINTEGVFRSAEYKSVLKHRMIAGHHHLLRLDHDPTTDFQLVEEPQIQRFLEKIMPEVDAVVVSDYGKGLLTTRLLQLVANIGKQNNIPILADPRKGADYCNYQHYTVLKPNRREACEATDIQITSAQSAIKAAATLKAQLQVEYVIISLDKDGLLLYQNEEHHVLLDAETQEVFDVVGAGDMIISILGYMLAGKANINHAAYWAQLAASMEIQYVGVVSFTKQELLQRFDFGHTSAKILTLPQLCRYLKQTQPPIVVFTNGYFDDLSAGHLKFLHQLKSLKGFNIVAINSDNAIAAKKGKYPLLNEQERAMLLSVVEAVDRVVIFDQPDAGQLLNLLRPNIVVKGEQYRTKTIREQEIIEKIGAQVKFFPEY